MPLPKGISSMENTVDFSNDAPIKLPKHFIILIPPFYFTLLFLACPRWMLPGSPNHHNKSLFSHLDNIVGNTNNFRWLLHRIRILRWPSKYLGPSVGQCILDWAHSWVNNLIGMEGIVEGKLRAFLMNRIVETPDIPPPTQLNEIIVPWWVKFIQQKMTKIIINWICILKNGRMEN